MTRWTMFSDIVYYHCSEFQIFRPLNGLHLSVLSLYPNSVQNQAWFCLNFSDHGKPKQTDVIFSRFVSLSLVNHGRLPRKNWPIAGFSPLLLIGRKNRRYWHKTKRLREGWLLNLKIALFSTYNWLFLRLMRTRFKPSLKVSILHYITYIHQLQSGQSVKTLIFCCCL